MADVFDAIALELFGGDPSRLMGDYLKGANHVPVDYFIGKTAGAFRRAIAQPVKGQCSTCRHGHFGRNYNEPLIGNLVTGYECDKRVMVNEEGNPPGFGCSLWEHKP